MRYHCQLDVWCTKLGSMLHSTQFATAYGQALEDMQGEPPHPLELERSVTKPLEITMYHQNHTTALARDVRIFRVLLQLSKSENSKRSRKKKIFVILWLELDWVCDLKLDFCNLVSDFDVEYNLLFNYCILLILVFNL